MQKKFERTNLESIFGVKRVPKESQMRERLDQVKWAGVRLLLPQIFEQVRRRGWLIEWRNEIRTGREKGFYYVVAIDGSDYFSSEKVSCENCLRRENRAGEINYRHTVVAGTLVKADKREILPMAVEMCERQDGSQKQDCEVAAGKRLIRRMRAEHPHLAMVVTGDDLYSRVPFVEECQQQRLHYVLVAKEESQQELFAWVTELEETPASQRVSWEVGERCRRKYYEGRIVREVPLRGDGKVFVTYVEVWERNLAGEQTSHNGFVTDLEVTTENVKEIIGIGRAKWKIENEQFNIQKNHGYHLEHNYGHGEKNLSAVFYCLNLIAYLLHLIIERGDRVYQKARATVGSRKRFWEEMRTLMRRCVWASWQDFMEFVGNEEAYDSG